MRAANEADEPDEAKRESIGIRGPGTAPKQSIALLIHLLFPLEYFGK